MFYIIVVVWWPLVQVVACKHTLHTHGYGCHCLGRGPIVTQNVQADMAIGVYMRVYGDLVNELNLWRGKWVFVREYKSQSVTVINIKWVVQD